MSKKTKDPWVRIIDVSEPVLHKKGYTLYKVTSKVGKKGHFVLNCNISLIDQLL